MDFLFSLDTWIAFFTLSLLEIILGIDNIIFISIISNKLPPSQQKKARTIGLLIAMLARVAFLLSITWIIKFSSPLFTFTVPQILSSSAKPIPISIRDIILALGGLFLIAKSTLEMFAKLENNNKVTRLPTNIQHKHISITSVITQIILLDIIFSFDSTLTAVGMVDHVSVMIAAMMVAIIIMMASAGKISNYIKKHPSLEALALGFLILIGFTLFVEALHQELQKGYIYFAIIFSLSIELFNIHRKKNK